ncbi:MAG: hypothetical protein MUC96_09855 [Myxococcaceae bacterium]|nr:hypothetical protein [Myxococcaceae bacterium]
MARGLALALLGTFALGLWMRLAMLGLVPLGLEFSHVRHAHSHLGAYGVLFPLAFLAWRRTGAFALPRWALALYTVSTVASVAGFLTRGYGALAIAGSTVVAAGWLWGAWGLRHRLMRTTDPLSLVPLSIVAALSCVPFIALMLRKAPAFAQQLVATFLGALLLLVVAPSALSALGARLRWTPALWLCGVAGVASLGLWEHPVTRAGLVVYAAALGLVALRPSLRLVTRWSWGLLGLGLGALALGLVPNVRPSVLGAIHFLVLAPVLLSLAPLAWEPRSTAAELVLLVAVSAVAAPLLAQAFGHVAGTFAITTTASFLVAGWWSWASLASPSVSE